MGKTQDPNIDMDHEEELDPFAEIPEGGDVSSDPFDFSENPPPGASPSPPAPAKGMKSPKRPAASPSSSEAEPRVLGMTADVPIQVVAVLGKKTTTVKEIVSLKKGQVIELNRFPNEAVDLVANGKLMAKGELVEIDGKLGVRIIKIFD
jgi:type III secretion system YscQ/HrcQ family protein